MQRAFIYVAVLSAALTCVAQDVSSGGVRGTVFDQSNARIAGATIVLVNNATGFRHERSSDSAGSFAFELLPPGEYSARVVAEGMSPQVSPSLGVNVGGMTEIDFKLTLAGPREAITVSAEAKQVETEPRGVSSVIDERAILNLPLNGRRFTDLTLLTPGVTPDPRGQNSTSNGDLSFGGIRGFQTSYLVDGGDNNNAFFGQARGRYRAPYQFSNEVVQEFRLSSNTYGAEFGRARGAVVNEVTKSGANRLYGTDYYFIRDSTLAAKHHFMDFTPKDQQQQFGLTLGGPLRRNRVF